MLDKLKIVDEIANLIYNPPTREQARLCVQMIVTHFESGVNHWQKVIEQHACEATPRRHNMSKPTIPEELCSWLDDERRWLRRRELERASIGVVGDGEEMSHARASVWVMVEGMACVRAVVSGIAIYGRARGRWLEWTKERERRG